jgi:hypothetical protein
LGAPEAVVGKVDLQSIDLVVRAMPQEEPEGNRHLATGKGRAEARMRAMPEAKMAVGIPSDLQLFGIRENRGIAVSGP